MNILNGLSYESIQEINKSLLDDGSISFPQTPQMAKALGAGGDYSTSLTELSQLTSGRAITVENIERDLKVTAEQESDLVWWNLLRKSPIYAVLDQYMVQSDLGIDAHRHVFGKFKKESQFPKTSDVTLERKVDTTKFIRDMRDITHVMESVQTMVDHHQIINRAAATTVLEANELATVYGDSDVIPSQFDGLLKKLNATEDAGYDCVIDCRATGSSSNSKGEQITENQLEQGAEKIRNSFGIPTNLVMPFKVKSDLNAILPVSRRVVPGLQRGEMNMLGLPAAGFYTDFGWSGFGGDPQFKFNPVNDTFYPGGESSSMVSPAASVGTAPSVPTGVSASVSSDSASKFGTGDDGDYFYKVASLNADGISASEPLKSGGNAAVIAVTAGQKVTLTIAANDATITGYAIYRSPMDGTTSSECRWIADIKAVNPTGNTTFVDLNKALPGTSSAILISNAPQTAALDYRQLLPFVRMPLAFGLNGIVGVPYLYMMYSYLRTAKLSNPRTGGAYHVLFKNIRWSGSEF